MKKQNTKMFQEEKISTSGHKLIQIEQKFYCSLANQCQGTGCTKRLYLPDDLDSQWNQTVALVPAPLASLEGRRMAIGCQGPSPAIWVIPLLSWLSESSQSLLLPDS